MVNCTAVIGSMPTAMKAQKALAVAAVRANVVKLDSSVTKRGCAYGVEYDCIQEANVKAIMNASGICISRIVRGGGYM